MGHPLKGPCQEEKVILGEKIYFLAKLPYWVTSISTFAEISFWFAVTAFTAPVTHQDQGHER